MTKTGVTVAACFKLLWTGAALAGVQPAQQCQAAKNEAVGRYVLCRENAEATLAKAGDTANYEDAITTCETRYQTAWQRAEQRAVDAGGACTTTGDQTAVQAVTDEYTGNVAQHLGGAPLEDCPGDLATCTTERTTCNGNLTTCNSNYSTCTGSLTTCNSNYSTCASSLTTCSGNLTTVNAGTATAADVLSGKTFSSSAGLGVVGSVPAGANVSGPNGSQTFTIPDGLYAGYKTATANDTNLVAGNIVKGVSIFGVVGTQPPAQPLKTGQTTSYAGGDDGAVQKGAALSYTDNADGTITDNNTGLMWERKVKLDSTPDGTNPHDADNRYPWGGSCTSETACNSGGTCCQTSADCVSPHTCTITDAQSTGLTIFGWVAQLNTANFAGHNDWRIPNVRELHTIVDYGVINPSVASAFQGASCGAGCTDITSAACSCTVSGFYWSSSTVATTPGSAWGVTFSYGTVGLGAKVTNFYVRAVRGGL
jgi:hypothetical protein